MERTKGHDNNTFTLQNVIFIVKVSAVVAISGYCGYPKIINVLEALHLWFSLVLSNVFFVFIIVNALIGSIFFSFLKTTGNKKQDLYDEYISAVRPSPETSFLPMEVGDYGGGYYSNSRSHEITVVPFQAVNTVEESKCYERVVTETRSKSCRRTTSLEKKKRSTVEYRRTESERVMKTTSSWRSQAMDELSSEEFQMKVETFIMGYKKKIYCQNGGADHWQEQPDHSRAGRRSRRLMGGGPYLAISN